MLAKKINSEVLCSIAEYTSCALFFDEPVGRVKMQTASKNSYRYYTTRCLIRDILSNTPNCYVRADELYRECVTEACEAERNWRWKSS